MQIVVEKAKRMLRLMDGRRELFRCPVGLGSCPEGAKESAGDGRTPEGRYHICLVKERGKFGRSLGLDYPAVRDAQQAYSAGRIDEKTLRAVESAHAEGRRPPWGSPLGGEIYLHEGGALRDWTAGCIALDEADMDKLFPLREDVEWVEILK